MCKQNWKYLPEVDIEFHGFHPLFVSHQPSQGLKCWFISSEIFDHISFAICRWSSQLLVVTLPLNHSCSLVT